MKLDHPFLQLPLSFDADALAREVSALGEAVWRPHPQGYPGNSALPLISVAGDPASDAVRGEMKPTPQLLACPYLMQVLHSIGAVWGRSRLMRLEGQAEVTPHVDINYYWREHTRVHVPIVTQPTVRFICGDAEVNMAAGECWTFDTWRMHHVHNEDDRARIHLVADTVGGAGFLRLLRGARRHNQDRTGWHAERITPGRMPASLDYETVNLPLVMSPWEVREHIRFLLAEGPSSPERERLEHRVLQPFAMEWHALWAKYGESRRGFDEYQALRERLKEQLAPYAELRLKNDVYLVHALQAIVVGNLLASEGSAEATSRPVPGSSKPDLVFAGTSFQFNVSARQPPVASPARSVAGAFTPVRIERPVIVLSAPRSGSTLLFETLAQAPQLYTIGHESHRTIEGQPGLHPSARDFDSNRLTAADASATVADAVRAAFAEALHDRHGRPPRPGVAVRLLEKTPKNILRVPFLRKVFPDAQFVYLYRDPRAVLSSMIEAWQSGRFRTYPGLPGWNGLPWSLLLVPGWRELNGLPLEEIVAHQWHSAVNVLLDDLETLPRESWVALRYDDLVLRPESAVRRICDVAGLEWDRTLHSLPLSRHTLTPPDPDKWRRHEAAIARVLPLLETTRLRAEALAASR